MTSVFVNNEDGTQKRTHTSIIPCDKQKQRLDWCILHTKKTPSIAGNNQKLGDRCGIHSPSEPTEGPNFVDTLISDLSPELWENKFPK